MSNGKQPGYDRLPPLDLRVPYKVVLYYRKDATHKRARAVVELDTKKTRSGGAPDREVGIKGLVWDMAYIKAHTRKSRRKRWTALPSFVTIHSDADCCYIDKDGNVVCYP